MHPSYTFIDDRRGRRSYTFIFRLVRNFGKMRPPHDDTY